MSRIPNCPFCESPVSGGFPDDWPAFDAIKQRYADATIVAADGNRSVAARAAGVTVATIKSMQRIEPAEPKVGIACSTRRLLRPESRSHDLECDGSPGLCRGKWTVLSERNGFLLVEIHLGSAVDSFGEYADVQAGARPPVVLFEESDYAGRFFRWGERQRLPGRAYYFDLGPRQIIGVVVPEKST